MTLGKILGNRGQNSATSIMQIFFPALHSEPTVLQQRIHCLWNWMKQFQRYSQLSPRSPKRQMGKAPENLEKKSRPRPEGGARGAPSRQTPYLRDGDKEIQRGFLTGGAHWVGQAPFSSRVIDPGDRACVCMYIKFKISIFWISLRLLILCYKAFLQRSKLGNAD